MDNDDCDLFSIVHSCKANTYTSPTYTSPTTIFEPLISPQNLTTTSSTTNNIIYPQNTTPSYFDDFSLTQENRSVNFSPFKPTDFIELDKLKINFNPTTAIPIYTTTMPISITPTTTIVATLTTVTTTSIHVPTCITTATITNTINHDSNQNSNFLDFPTFITERHMQPTTIIPTPIINNLTPNVPTHISSTFTSPNLSTNIFTPDTTTTTPSITTMINSNISSHGTNNYPNIYNFPKCFEQQQIQRNQNNQLYALKPAYIEITRAHFDVAYNHQSVSKQYSRECNQLPILQPQTSFMVLPNTNPQGELCKNTKRKYGNQKKVEWHVSVEKVGEDPWEWRKYGEKPIKGSRHTRFVHIRVTFRYICFRPP